MATKKQKLFSDTLLYMVGNFGSKTISFFLVPFYTRYLTTSEYGIMDLVNTSKSLILPFIYLQIIAGVYRFLIISDAEKKRQIISSSFFFVVAMVSISVLLFYFGIHFFDFTINYINLIISMFVLSIFNNLFRQVLRGLDKIRLYSVSGIASTFIISVLNIYFIGFLDMSYNGMLLATSISLVISSLIIFIYGDIYKYINYKYIDKNVFCDLIKYSVPLIPNTIGWWFMNVSDRYLIRLFLNFEYLGIYAIANKFASVIFLFNTIFYQAWQTSAIDEFDSNDKNDYYTEIFNYLLSFQLILVLLGVMSVKLFIPFLVGAEFVTAWKYTPILFLGAMFQSFASFYGTGYLSTGNTMKSLMTTSLGAFLNLLINLILIPKIGLFAASISTFVAYLILWIVRILTTKNYFNIRINYKKLTIGLILIFISMRANYFKNLEMILLINFIVLFSMVYINKNILVLLFDKIKSFYNS